jgi:hypothetical protein
MKYFTITELCYSSTARKRGIANEPTAQIADNLVQLTEKVLDPLREAYGKPIQVNSGYRCRKLNKVVGGVSNSQHIEGKAADIHGTPDTPEENRKLFELAKSLCLPFDQLIDERDMTWVHLSYDRSRQRRQVLKL